MHQSRAKVVEDQVELRQPEFKVEQN